MDSIGKRDILVTKIALLLLGLNFIAGFLWIFGFQTIRLLLLVSTGLVLLFLFFIKVNTRLTISIKFYLLLLITFSILSNFSFATYQTFLIDFSTIGIILSVFLFSGLNGKLVKNGVLFMMLFSILYFAYTVPFMDLSIIRSGAYNRIEAFSSYGDEMIGSGVSMGYIIYSTQQLAVSFLLFFLLLLPFIYNRIKKRYVIIFLILIFIFIIIFSAFYQKRQQILELILCVVLANFFYKKLLQGLIPKSKIISFFILILFLIFIFSSDILSNVFSRFSDTLNNIKDFDRLEESRKVLSSFNILNWIIGKGFGYKAPDTPGGIILHIGYSNLLMKGGLILLLFYLFQAFKNIRYCNRKAKQYPVFYIGVAISIFSMIQLTYSPGYHWFVTSLIMGLAMFSRYPLKSIVHDKYYNTGS
jgi:hypothetical protein